MNNDYQKKKAILANTLTIYGRKPVLEVLQDPTIHINRLHLAESNKAEGIARQIEQLAKQRNIDIAYHDKKALSRISRNGKQDQGVAADIESQNYGSLDRFIAAHHNKNFQLLAIDKVTNPQNLGMIIRSVCASGISGVLIPEKGCAALSPLVIKASVGTVFRTPIVRCASLQQGLTALADIGTKLYALGLDNGSDFYQETFSKQSVFILGNESEGISQDIQTLSHKVLTIPMHNQVESLNVAVTAAIVAFAIKQQDMK